MRTQLICRNRMGETTLDKMLSDILEGADWPFAGLARERPLTGFQPKINVSETKKEFQITAELPGLDEKDIHVDLDEDILTIHGERNVEEEEEGEDKQWYRREQSYGSFSRAIPLPSQVDGAKVKARFKKGLLTVRLPKRKPDDNVKKAINIEIA